MLSLFSKCPAMHIRVLEIPGGGKVAGFEGDVPAFHFSGVNYGDYGFFD
jgi:hypothetical protein